jgi:hypothetical protein
MKKTLQKEFKFNLFPNEQTTSDNSTNRDSLAPNRNINKLNGPINHSHSHSPSPTRNSTNTPLQNITPKITSQKQLAQSISATLQLPSNRRPSVTSTSSLNNAAIASPNAFQSALKKSINNPSQLSSLHEDINFKYLKHVVLKFLTSREYEVK